MKKILFIITAALSTLTGCSVSSKLGTSNKLAYSTSASEVTDQKEKEQEKVISLAFSEVRGNATIKRNIFGDTIIEDNKGTFKKDIFRDITIKDNKGNKKTITKDISGNITIKDNKGNKKTITKDISGNIIIKDNRGNKKTITKDISGI